jgi:hypothetical protein
MLARRGNDDDQVALGRLLAGLTPLQALTPAELDDAWELATCAGVDALLGDLLSRAGDGVTGTLREAAASRLREAHAHDMARVAGLRALVAAFDTAGIRALLMKGASLAYTIYPAPHLRPFDDVDLLIRRDSLAAADAALIGAGFQRQLEPDSDLASMQRHYVRPIGAAGDHIVDLHWAVSNRHAFTQVVDFEQAWAESQAVPALGRARGLGTADALLLACVHRVAHHADHPSLIWLWDVHLLATSLTTGGLNGVVRRAERAQVAAVLAHGLRLARHRFGTGVPSDVLERLDRTAGEPSAQFIGGISRPIDWLRSDLAAAGSFGRRVHLLREHLFPARSYVGDKYAKWPRHLLPLAYLHRIVRGAPGWVRKSFDS